MFKIFFWFESCIWIVILVSVYVSFLMHLEKLQLCKVFKINFHLWVSVKRLMLWIKLKSAYSWIIFVKQYQFTDTPITKSLLINTLLFTFYRYDIPKCHILILNLDFLSNLFLVNNIGFTEIRKSTTFPLIDHFH